LTVIGALFATALLPTPGVGQSLDSSMDMLDFEAARNSFFGHADADADFALSGNELSDALGLSVPMIFDGRDYDGDGMISYSEYLQSGAEIFAAHDSDGDGILTLEEF
jgi:hypothetical protein